MTPREVRALLAWLEAMTHGIDCMITHQLGEASDLDDFKCAWNKAVTLTEKIEKKS